MDVCNDIMFKHPFKERVFYDGFYVDVGHNDNYIVVLEAQPIAAWSYKNGEVRDLCIYNEELFKTFKEKYILENNQDKYIHPFLIWDLTLLVKFCIIWGNDYLIGETNGEKENQTNGATFSKSN